MIPIIITIGVSSLVMVASVIATLVILLNHLGGRIDQVSTDMGRRIDQAEARVTQAAAKDKAELLEAMRDSEQRLTEAMRDSENRMTHRMDRLEDRSDAQFESVRRELSESVTEQPVAGDD